LCPDIVIVTFHAAQSPGTPPQHPKTILFDGATVHHYLQQSGKLRFYLPLLGVSAIDIPEIGQKRP